MQKDIDNNVYSVRVVRQKCFMGKNATKKLPSLSQKVVLEQWLIHLLTVYRHKHTVNEQSS